MFADESRSSCPLRNLTFSPSEGSAPSCPLSSSISVTVCKIAVLIFSFISAAAALVKVTTSMRSMDVPSSSISRLIRSTSTAVLPSRCGYKYVFISELYGFLLFFSPLHDTLAWPLAFFFILPAIPGRSFYILSHTHVPFPALSASMGLFRPPWACLFFSPERRYFNGTETVVYCYIE